MRLSLFSVVAAGCISSTAAAGIPAVCWDICNSALLEGRRVGWGNHLCEPGSPFMNSKLACYTCVLHNGTPGETRFQGTQFEEIIHWC